MDPKKVSDLDPKLKEVYERVMGTKIPTSPKEPIQESHPSKTPPRAQPTQPTKQQAASPKAAPLPGTVQVFTTNTASAATSPTAAPEKKAKNSPVLAIVLIVAGLIFFAIYGLFWMRFFNVNLPFTLPI